MRTNIEIDDELMRQAMEISEGKTKKAVVEEALWRMVKLKRQGDALGNLRGIATWVGHDDDWFTHDPLDPEWNAELASRKKPKLENLRSDETASTEFSENPLAHGHR